MDLMSNSLMKVGAVLLVIMLFLGIADVAGRYLFNCPITGTLEVFQILMPGIVLLTWAFTQRAKAHVTVDVVVEKMPGKLRLAVRVFTTCWAFVLFALIAWQGILMAMSYQETGRVITNIGVPMYLPRLIVPVGALAMCMVLLEDVRECFKELKR